MATQGGLPSRALRLPAARRIEPLVIRSTLSVTGAARMLVPEKGKGFFLHCSRCRNTFRGDFGFELCRFIKLLATANGVLWRHGQRRAEDPSRKGASAGARC